MLPCTFFLSGAIYLLNESVFNNHGTASFDSNEAMFGGEMLWKKKNPLGSMITYVPKICHSSRLNLYAPLESSNAC